MRKHLIWVLGVVVVAGSVVVAGLATAAPNSQSIVASVGPKKLPKNKRQAVTLNVNVFATNPGNPGQLPFATENAKVDLDKNILLQQKGYPTCDPTQFGSADTVEDVEKECGDAAIGSGSATVVVAGAPGAPPVTIAADVVGANVSNDRVLLHTQNPLSGGTTLVGKLTKQGGTYGTLFNVDVPPLAGGAGVITQFQIKFDKVSYRNNGKKLAIISSNCKDKSMDFRARFTDNQGQLATGTDTHTCKRKG